MAFGRLEPAGSSDHVGSVGLFWVVQTGHQHQSLIAHVCPEGDWESYDDLKTCPHGHYQKWLEWRRRPTTVPAWLRDIVSSTEYEEWPRGRLVRSERQVLVYADRQLHRPVYEDAIRLAYGLAGAEMSIHADVHYRLARKLAAAPAIDVIRA